MLNNKILIGGLAGGVVFFLLGWLIFGYLLMDYYTANTNQCAMKPMTDMIYWAMILSNFAFGLLTAMIFSWSNTSGIIAGAKVAATIGFLISFGLDFNFYSMTTMFSNFNVIIVDILANTVFMAVGGAVIAWAMGMVNKGA